MNQPNSYLEGSPEASLAIELDRLPPLPRTIVYEDDYDEVVRSIPLVKAEDELQLTISGELRSISFLAFEQPVRTLVRHFLLMALLDSAPASVSFYYYGLRKHSSAQLTEIAMADPLMVKARWTSLTNDFSKDAYAATKAFLGYLCDIRLKSWAPQFRTLVENLPVPHHDQYAVVRAGDCFLEIEEEAKIVRWIDEAVVSWAVLSENALRLASLVVCSYQFGMRPKQLGTLRKRDCEIRWSNEDGLPSVYLTFRMLKQRDPLASRLPLLRKVKREWAPLVAATHALLHAEPSTAFFFGFDSRRELSDALIGQLNEILPGMGRVAYDLRHSMAQRMVDAGASQEEIAAALGHTHLTSGLVYFRASANQSELVNKALGLSETYRMVAQIAADRFISNDDLARLKSEQQIAGVPHGIPIAGIGACKTSQPSCPYNPVTACYGCPKFMPVRDVAIHEQVLRDFRGVVNEFRIAGAGDQESPAYMQLRRTISEVQGVIDQLEGCDAP
jgi:integrase